VGIERVFLNEAGQNDRMSVRNPGDVSIEIYLGKEDPRIFSYQNMQHLEMREIPGEGFVLVGKY
jgi:hypothetical protein